MGCRRAAGCDLKQLFTPGQSNASFLSNSSRKVSAGICRKGGQQLSMNTKEQVIDISEGTSMNKISVVKNLVLLCSLTLSFATFAAAALVV